MSSNMPEEIRADLERVAASAEPYPDDAPELHVLDGDLDTDRMMATLAKKALNGEL
ncbi:hypothetical protein [Bittarella massiliensis (ex Durand et al. 2017)]|uniref:hypothetical protein n=1 Tax=Bittarella massiliensis (ex Durand et al. 2017) TaxID=1720313 RepID=UPI001AA0F653|nr:hypothetical protein [Bittarella massiliensis (ex Durand et al. 2017)]MBO1680364.1 hypothetical protein [Bittarella massiliensis (ex Durand et al. 2017)]